MPNYLSPGVYVEEVQAASRPIEGVGTAVAAFVGLAQKGPANTPVMVTNWTQFVASFGDFMEGSYLAHSLVGASNSTETSALSIASLSTSRRRAASTSWITVTSR